MTSPKISWATQAMAKELAGHGSSTVSAVYTHLPPETLAEEIRRIPEFSTQEQTNSILSEMKP